MNKLILENYFTTSLMNVVDDSSTWEIEFQLSVAPASDFWYLIIDYVDTNKREEIFYHRKSGSSVYTYWVNRNNPRSHDIWASVQINDSASIFNYITTLLPTHFFMYKTSETTCFIKGWNIFDNGEYKVIPDRTDISLSTWTNHIYIQDWVIEATTSSVTDKLIVGEVVVDWAGNITELNHNNTISTSVSRPNAILRGSVNPSWATGNNGDYYINDTTSVMFWPKTGWAWWTGFSIQWEPGLQWVPWPQWIPGSAYEAPATGQEQELEDNNIPQDLSAVNTTVWVQIEIVYNDWSKTVYTATTIKYYDIDWDLYAQETWLNGSWNWSNIEYTWSHIAEVNWITWVVTFSGHVAYTNMVNTFQEWNVFKKASIFNWPAVFWLNWPWAWNYEIDFSTSSKQYVALPNAQTISWVNIVNGVTLLVAVDNTSWGSLPLTLGTFMNIDWVKEYDKYQIGDMPTTLDAWIHMFVMEVFSTGIHICYSWQSTAII